MVTSADILISLALVINTAALILALITINNAMGIRHNDPNNGANRVTKKKKPQKNSQGNTFKNRIVYLTPERENEFDTENT